MEIDYVSIGKRIREIRKSKKMTQAVLAEKAEIEPSNMSHIERAATKTSLATLIKIANALEVTLDELVYGSLVKSSHISVGLIDRLLSDCTPDEIKAIAEIIKTTKNILRRQKG
ncbi:MAG: helix-turn-helix domain-containing protein [Acutalibacteraceae bacterium]